MPDPAPACPLRTLRVVHLRRCREVAIATAAPVVVLTGGNGAGKTTLLEAVYLLARGRSFRGRKAGPMTTRGERGTLVEARCDADAPDGHLLRYRRDHHGREHSLDGRPWPPPGSVRPLRIKLIGENAQSLLEGDPALRRTFLDWNLFHVEPRLGALRRELSRVQQQRNAALRRGGGRELTVWDQALGALGERIDDLRQAFFAHWHARFQQLTAAFPFLDDCELRLARGWPMTQSLAEAIAAARPGELARGHTLVGPGRADVQLTRDGARLALSRGQAKVVVCLLQLAAEQVHRDQGLAPALWLLDDLEAELDARTLARLWEVIGQREGQCLLTRVATAADPGPYTHPDTRLVFHVEQGAVVDDAST
ncbi:DNA replication/repair protein RecF [Marichromatium bheemlicum]|uniref:DNA replication and repair protein RecF n=1 Tax=Marichromatium bheemlicum TaxID=365339 RepID=A0ABX1IA01_9GAMM|nr:DNA replication and repair protein RecF [Marichromatium bheemlicum]NKN34113.1 DNA replication and repair protein RecF [Marichromatium bheemlicum]